MNAFNDHFSTQSSAYAAFRPTYPKALYDFIVKHAPDRAFVWDAGTGNGQAAFDLADYFDRVHATDPSAEQIKNAQRKANIEYAVGAAEHVNLPSESCSAVTAAQASHWFSHDEFYAEAKRVLKPKGLICLWAYGTHRAHEPALDRLITHIAHGILADYWPQRAKLVWDDYRDLPFPFEKICAPELNLAVHWNLAQLTGYMSSWSAAQKYLEKNGHPVLEPVMAELAHLWGDPAEHKELYCRLVIRAGLKD